MDEKSCVTFLLCDPGWYVQRTWCPEWMGRKHTHTSQGNPFKCHEEVLYLQPTIPPKRFDIFSPWLTGGCSEGLGAFRFFIKYHSTIPGMSYSVYYIRTSWYDRIGNNVTFWFYNTPIGTLDCVCVFLPIHSGHQVGRTSRGHTGGRSHRISHPPSFCGACLNFPRLYMDG